ncbi:MAG: antitoxin VapB family protein [Candidatus Aenigmarchaeota archaeon]|nr:antitoxin VapB family protein [Candidatus Aenigmarchaeota archaeon]
MTRVISLSDEAYDALKKMKGEGESFSKVVVKLTEKEKNRGIMAFAGVWKDKPEMEKIMKKIIKGRKKFRTREVKF